MLLCIEVQFHPYAKPTSVRHGMPSIFPLQAKFQSNCHLSLLLLRRTINTTTVVMSSLCVAIQGVLHCLGNFWASSSPHDARERVDITRPLAPALILTGRIPHSRAALGGRAPWSASRRSTSKVGGRCPKPDSPVSRTTLIGQDTTIPGYQIYHHVSDVPGATGLLNSGSSSSTKITRHQNRRRPHA